MRSAFRGGAEREEAAAAQVGAAAPPGSAALGAGPLRTIAEHVECVLARVRPTAAVRVGLADAAADGPGLVLAAPVVAVGDVPSFDHAAVDGYALARPPAPAPGQEPGGVQAGVARAEAVHAEAMPGDVVPAEAAPGDVVHGEALRGEALRGDVVRAEVVRTLRAGDVGGAPLRPGQAARIMTGAPLPPGADVVVPVEHSSTGRFQPGHDDGETAVTLRLPRRDNIRRRGEDLTAGTVLAKPGDAVTPALIATAAAAGLTALTVYRRPRVAVVSTGSELRAAGTGGEPGTVGEPGAATGAGAGDEPGPGPGVVDSNSLMLAAIARAAGAQVLRRGAVRDDAASLREVLDEAVAAGADLIVTTGGVSAGAWDVVRQVLLDGGHAGDPAGDGAGDPAGDIDLTGVEMRPGRPQALASWRGVPWIGLPGTPTAAFTAAHLFVRPAIDRLRGSPRPGPARVALPVALTDTSDRTRVLPVRLCAPAAPRIAVPLASGGHALSALLAADGLAVVPPGAGPALGPVEVLLLREAP